MILKFKQCQLMTASISLRKLKLFVPFISDWYQLNICMPLLYDN